MTALTSISFVYDRKVLPRFSPNFRLETRRVCTQYLCDVPFQVSESVACLVEATKRKHDRGIAPAGAACAR